MNKYVRPAVIAPSLKTVGHKIANDPTGLLGLDERPVPAHPRR
jgi:hypothetical protein